MAEIPPSLGHVSHAEEEARLREALALHRRGQSDAALAALLSLVAAHPASPRVRVALAFVQHATGELTEAAASCEAALGVAPGFVPALVQLALVCRDRGEHARALALHEQVAALAPSLREAHFHVGVAAERVAQRALAVAAYERALALDPGYAAALGNLANALVRDGRRDEALALYRRLEAVDADSGLAQHMIAALTGATTARCPPDFVRALFDASAASFDDVLVNDLAYRTPAALAALVLEAGFTRGSVLDLGCGTGLFGREVRGHATRLVGVDLSSRMLEVARRGGDYDALEAEDIEAYLAATERAWDLIALADVFPYLGAPAPWLAACARVLAPGGRIALSTELTEQGDLVLGANGRYAHRPEALVRAASESGLVVLATRRLVLRREGDGGVSGALHVLGRA